ncbi:MAG: type II toxin-antitoxin system RelE/ParE family toxin [Komarekiella atlantica HA4396-MV6]|jgi:plasmid stabilization system protein ParE|nr:type II toxin-antitoxin system RelE/ParE family toxin [Komarekiella atlantica HA4396-MV6]
MFLVFHVKSVDKICCNSLTVIKPNNTDAAARAIQAIVSSGESLQQNPRRGAIVDEIAGLRKLLVSFGKYGFIIHYVILRIYHGRENQLR